MLQKIIKLSSPPVFYSFATPLIYLIAGLGFLCLSFGIWYSLFITPVDAQQGEVYRVLYVHVPAAWLSMFIYVVACAYAAIYWIVQR